MNQTDLDNERDLILSKQALTVFAHLVYGLAKMQPGHPNTYMTYGDVHKALNLPGTAHDLEHQGLAELAQKIHMTNLPAITGLVIRKDTSMPGDGYFRLYGRPLMDFEWWKSEMVKTKLFDWTPYLSAPKHAAKLPPAPQSPKASDLEKPARVQTTIYRVLRDTSIARRVKQMHGYRCQICGETIVLADGSRYAEAHHIRPLGVPHDGPDIDENILCVCPNHHAELDYFARAIDQNTLIQIPDHHLGPIFVEYHNTLHRKLLKRRS